MKHANMKGLIGESWIWPLGRALDYFKGTIVPFLETEVTVDTVYRSGPSKKLIYPSSHNIFRAFKEVPFDTVRVVIIGQDPYHCGAATGLAFDNPKTQPMSPSLNNIVKEIVADLGASNSANNVSTYLEHLPAQGVLLLNTSLTVEKERPGSHTKIWAPFTRQVIQELNARSPKIVWVLWGNHAKKLKPLITNPKHIIIEGAHPSPFAFKKFKGQKFFSRISNNLTTPISW